MKIIGIIIVLFCFLVNIVIGYVLYQGKTPLIGFVSSLRVDYAANVDTSEKIAYTNSSQGFSFMYPKSWIISTTSKEKEDDVSLLDIFRSLDSSDGFTEGFFLSLVFGPDFTSNIDTVRNNLSANGFQKVSEKDVSIAGYRGYQFVYSGRQLAVDNSVLDIKAMSYLLEFKDKTLLFDFSDLDSSFEKNSQIFTEIVNSIK